MDTPTNPPVRFGVFELDERAGELRRSGRRVALQPQPLEILRALLERPGEVVTREELRRRLWSNGAYVDFDRSLNKAIVKLRDALGDDADSPRYIETLPRHGYRFIPLPHAHVDAAPGEQNALTADMPQPEGAASLQPSAVPRVQSAGTRHWWRWAAVGLTLLALAASLIWSRLEGPSYSGPLATVAPAGAVAFAPPPHSIAVLPFVNISGDKEQEYFSDGLTEELLSSLSHINELQVAARTSAFSFKGKDSDIGTIARKLNVASVLEGSVRRSGHRIRITAQLNNAVTGFHIWSQSYDRDLGDALKLQTDIATAVAGALKVTLLGDVGARIELGGSRNPTSVDEYLRGTTRAFTAHTPDDYLAAIVSFSEAVRLDPNYALAFAGRSLALSNSVCGKCVAVTRETPRLTARARRDTLDKALADAREAIARAPELAEGHLGLAVVLENSLDFARAKTAYERALTLAPGSARVLKDYGDFAVNMGWADAGIAALRRALVLDPLNHNAHRFLGESLFNLRRYQDSVTAYREALAIDPDDSLAYAGIGMSYYALGDFQEARSWCEAKADPFASACLALTYDRLGRHADAAAELAKFRTDSGDAYPYWNALIYAGWGDTVKALGWLERGMRDRDWYLEQLKVDPFLDSLRKEPRFQAIERELKFPKY